MKEGFMSQNNSNDNRVVVRRGARKLSEKEAEQVTGGALTLASCIPTNGGRDQGLDQ
ncbi:MAG TPA: hypothetical protein VFY05_03815 [Candidatus Angelobacter sp.]|nr:hypothetical protein [Candidatus Angelobacter sp.]